MNKIYLWTIIISTTLLGCDKKTEPVDNSLKLVEVESRQSKYDIEFTLPKTFVSVREMDKEKQMDTLDVQLNLILDVQFDDPDSFCFFDSLDKRTNIYVKSGPRVDINNKERKTTYFTVPTVSLDKVFPKASDGMEITMDTGEKKYKEKTYYKRRYRAVPDNGNFTEFYYVSTKWQSTLFIIKSAKEMNFENWILDYKVVPK